MTEEEEYFFQRVDIRAPHECWPWTGTCTRHKRGLARIKKKQVYAYRLALLVYGNPVPADQCVLHKCDNPNCVNPNHLMIGTQAENIKDMFKKGRNSPLPVSRGVKNANAKLNPDLVREIRSRHTAGASYSEIAKIIGRSKSCVSFVVTKRTWSHVD